MLEKRSQSRNRKIAQELRNLTIAALLVLNKTFTRQGCNFAVQYGCRINITLPDVFFPADGRRQSHIFDGFLLVADVMVHFRQVFIGSF